MPEVRSWHGATYDRLSTPMEAMGREVLERLPLAANSDDFLFDNQILVQAFAAGYRVGELSCPTKYFAEASSINFGRSVRYGFGVLAVSFLGLLARAGLYRAPFLRVARGGGA